MSINIIAAISKNKVIGLNGIIPWKISKDLKYFKRVTSGKLKYDPPGINVCLMGRKTWDSLPTYPNPLPNRASIVVTKNNTHKIRSNMIYNNIPSDEDMCKIKNIYSNIWICGGESIYNHFINKPYIDKLYLTEIQEDFEGDTFFPEIPSYFHKVIQGETQTFSLNAIQFANYNFNVYRNLSFPKTYL
jgi:dihydrofolate reductase